MMKGVLDRRQLLGMIVTTTASNWLFASDTSRQHAAFPVAGVILIDGKSSTARRLALRQPGHEWIELAGDPVRLWRDRLLGYRGPVSGLTTWSDYVLLRGLAEEQGLRVQREEVIDVAKEPQLFDWTASRPIVRRGID